MCEVCKQTPCHPRCPYAPDPPIVHECIRCGDLILEGDSYYDVDGEQWCEDCMRRNRKTAESEETQ